MKKLTKTISLILLCSLTSLGLAGCGNHTNSTSHHASTHTTEVSHNHKTKSHKKSCKKHHTKKSHKAVKHSQEADKSNNKSQHSSQPSDDHHNSSMKLGATHNKSTSNNGLPQVNLGNGVHANEDHGAGQTYISFTSNGHHVVVHGSNFGNGNAQAINKARSIAQNINQLPKSQTNVDVDA